MIETLYVNGCSWTAGDEIESDIKFMDFLKENELMVSPLDKWSVVDKNGDRLGSMSDFRHEFNWGGVITKKLKIKKYINGAVGGASNDKIYRETIDFLQSTPKIVKENLFVIIGWTAGDRKEIYIPETKSFERFNANISFSKSLMLESTLSKKMRKIIDKYHEIYLENIFDYYECVKRKTQQIYSLANILENQKIRYLFFNSIQGLNEEMFDFSLTDEFSNFFMWYNGNKNIYSRETMQLHIVNSKCPVGEYKHPLIDGHEIWADVLIRTIKNKNL